MTCRIGINGFGRIGRMVLRRTLTLPDVEVVAVNDLARIGELAYLLKYDSVHGLFPGEVTHEEQSLRVNGAAMQFSSEKDPSQIPWGQAGVDVVIESTGALRGRQDAAGHLHAGARKVLISAPSDDVDVTIVPGVNDAQYDRARHHVLSMASCTTNSLAPVAKVLQDRFGIARTLKVRGEIISQVNRYLGGFCSSQRIFPPQIIQGLLIVHLFITTVHA